MLLVSQRGRFRSRCLEHQAGLFAVAAEGFGFSMDAVMASLRLRNWPKCIASQASCILTRSIPSLDMIAIE